MPRSEEYEPQVSYDKPTDHDYWLVTLYWTDGSKITQYVTVPDDDRTGFPPSEVLTYAIEEHGIGEEHLVKFSQEWKQWDKPVRIR